MRCTPPSPRGRVEVVVVRGKSRHGTSGSREENFISRAKMRLNVAREDSQNVYIPRSIAERGHDVATWTRWLTHLVSAPKRPPTVSRSRKSEPSMTFCEISVRHDDRFCAGGRGEYSLVCSGLSCSVELLGKCRSPRLEYNTAAVVHS